MIMSDTHLSLRTLFFNNAEYTEGSYTAQLVIQEKKK